jgi:hypothetical protein
MIRRVPFVYVEHVEGDSKRTRVDSRYDGDSDVVKRRRL